jgi:hypothetical protein
MRGLAWDLADDAEYVVVADEAGERSLSSVCAQAFKIFQENHRPGLNVQFCKAEPLVDRSGKNLVFCRHALKPTLKTAVYKPTPLTDQQLAEPNLKRAVAGAAFLGHFDKLPKSHLQVKWEVTTTPAPNISMKPIRPKLWIMGKITMEADYFYEVK